MHIIIIGNYPLDRVESMHRFARLLHLEFGKAGVTSEIWQPSVFFGYLVKSKIAHGANKWLGYADKFLIFPIILLYRMLNKKFSATHIRFHICDQGNAPYLTYLPKDRTVITCHDVLAIREALGYPDTHTPVSRAGRYFQKWILHHLTNSQLLAAVSESTLNQLRELRNDQPDDFKTWQVIHNALNADFFPMKREQREILLEEAGMDPKTRFVLHVGSNSLRKNRRLLIDMVKELGEHWDGIICFAGEEIDKELASYARSLSLSDRLICVIKPDHLTLVALYASCEAFIFPSFSEGFGWPLIEAQACGAPVIASKIPPLLEIGGGGCLYADPHMTSEFANKLQTLEDQSFRAELIAEGLINVKRFERNRMVEKYLELHGQKKLELLEAVLE